MLGHAIFKIIRAKVYLRENFYFFFLKKNKIRNVKIETPHVNCNVSIAEIAKGTVHVLRDLVCVQILQSCNRSKSCSNHMSIEGRACFLKINGIMQLLLRLTIMI